MLPLCSLAAGRITSPFHVKALIWTPCRPVGLCALINAVDYKPKHLLAVDSIQSRLDLAKSLGAEPWNFQTDREGLDKRVKELTDGRGADVVIGQCLVLLVAKFLGSILTCFASY